MHEQLFAQLQQLYEFELYNSAVTLSSLLLTLLQNERTIATREMEYQVLLYSANSLYQEQLYRRASKPYEELLMRRKTLVRALNKEQVAFLESVSPHFHEMESRYRLAVCYREVGEHSVAISSLQSLPAKQRTPKITAMLAKMLHYGRISNTADAIATYKDLLRSCPMALGAIDALLELGVDGIEVNSLVMGAGNLPKHNDWLNNWIKGHAQMYGRNQLEAAKTFQRINDTTSFHQNDILLTLIGRSFYYYGNFTQAQQYLETAAMINPYNMEAIMPLSVVLEYNQRVRELEKLCAPLNHLDEFKSEHWFVLAQCYYATGKLEKATSFTHKAISVNQRNIEAQLLRGKICLQSKRHKEAICFFRSAQYIANYRFEVYKGLFHCYLGLQRLKEAQSMCALAVRYFRNSPRSYVMFARTLFQSSNPVAKKSAGKFVSKALEIDEHYAPAVALMAEVHQTEGETKKAIALLHKQVVNYPHHKLFTMLGELLSAEKDLSGALEYYTIALNMEPSYYRALEGVNALGQAAKSNVTTKSMDVDQDATMGDAGGEGEPADNIPLVSTIDGPDDEWPIDCDDPMPAVVADLSSPAAAQEDPDSEAFSDPFWQDVDNELTN